MNLFVVNAFQILLLVQVSESVVFSWIWESPPIQQSSTTNISSNSSTSTIQQKYCKNDGDCHRGHYCHRHYGDCHKCKTTGAKCRRDHACCKGYECVFGKCRKEVKSGNYLSKCTKDKECKKGLCCAKSHGEFVCKPMLRRNQICGVLEGGVAYTVNHGCPCDDGLICKKVKQRRRRVKGTIPRKQKKKIRRCQKIGF